MTGRKMKQEYTFTNDSIKTYDELQNVQFVRRYSDTGFLDVGEYMATARNAFYRCDTNTNISNRTGTPKNIFVYTDKTGVNHVYMVRNNSADNSRVFNLYYTTFNGTDFAPWTYVANLYTGANLSQPEVYYDLIKVPVWIGGDPTISVFTTASAPTAVDRVKRDMTSDIDANTGNRSGANAIGRILYAVGSVYKFTYAYITGYDSTTNEYIIDGSGMIEATDVLGYKIYDTLGECVRISGPGFEDRCYQISTELTGFRGNATYSLRAISAISSIEHVGQIVKFGNSYFTFAGGTIYETKGLPGNPFFFNFLSANTISNKIISGLYVYKNRLIVYGESFIYGFRQDGIIERISESMGVRDKSIFSTGSDLYCISNNNKIIAINELQSGSLYVRDILERFSSYTQHWDGNTFIGADSTNIYFGGNSNTFSKNMYMCVFNLSQKYWSIWQCPSVASIHTNNGIAFFTSLYNNSSYILGAVTLSEEYPLGDNKSTPTGLSSDNFKQRIATHWNDTPGIKELSFIEAMLENTVGTNTMDVSVFMYLDMGIGSKDKRQIRHIQDTSVGTFGLAVTGAEIQGGTTNNAYTLFPVRAKLGYKQDPCRAFKVVLESGGGVTPAYSNEFFKISGFTTKFTHNVDMDDWVKVT